jgi:succinate dehydrogenase/fumarate reductase flavoprotein subunit
LLVAGAGMAGLVCAARARELGLRPRLLEKGTRPGGSMLLSSGVVWRHLEWERFRRDCPGGDEALQRLVWERLDEALDWLVSLGAEPVWQDTENPLTTGKRFDPRALTALLARDVELETPLPADAEPPLVLATGGFAKRLAASRGLMLRANPWSEGDGLDYALAHGAATTAGMDEFYARAMPAPPARIGEEDFVRLSQLYGREAQVLTDDGRDITPLAVAWHESDLAQLVGASAWYVVEQTNEQIESARAAGGTVLRRDDGRIAVHVTGAVSSRRRLRRGRRRRRRRHRRLRERPCAGARARPRRRRAARS